MKWPEILQLSGFQSIAALAPDATSIAPSIVLLTSDTYAFIVPYNERLERDAPGAPFATMAVWAESPGAARRALHNEIEADAPTLGKSPPAELLPRGSHGAYGEIVAAAKRAGKSALEFAEYRIATDGAFVHRVVQCDRVSYYFRSHKDDATECPYAIALKFGRPSA
jgi:hypothetical protein